MLGRTIQPPALSGRDMLPSWAVDLAPCVVETRELKLARGPGAMLECSRGDDAVLVTAVVSNVIALSAEGLRENVAAVYCEVLGALRTHGFAHAVRMWSFVPGIHEPMGTGLDRYRVFNAGRYDAFIKWFGGRAAFATVLPAASAVGHFGDELVVCALGLRTPGVAIENPRQTPASGYSRAHGPRPPCFARAMAVRLPTGPRLLVSGTASIRGESSVHPELLSKQVEETFVNLELLVRSVGGEEKYSLERVETARVYFPRAMDRATLMADVPRRLPVGTAVEFVTAHICREELLVEVEATLSPLPL